MIDRGGQRKGEEDRREEVQQEVWKGSALQERFSILMVIQPWMSLRSSQANNESGARKSALPAGRRDLRGRRGAGLPARRGPQEGPAKRMPAHISTYHIHSIYELESMVGAGPISPSLALWSCMERNPVCLKGSLRARGAPPFVSPLPRSQGSVKSRAQVGALCPPRPNEK
ncbi:hypothetical protein Q8A67_020524 [Cirrhinus molitorella]|uniref:Uncharacterized protein n=1 Tax=Cirrhinus molitorella TaxID=172907 RepID=A0AA88P5D9_9TELE|nr:hypothetical protein Q8A67_020524 [Cirrhinus molitorella]